MPDHPESERKNTPEESNEAPFGKGKDDLALSGKPTITRHAPHGWEKDITVARVKELLESGTPIQMVILCADIRRSTYLMKEAVDPKAFASEISGFVDDARKGIRMHGGWFDKFTGDGFLAYWLCDRDTWEKQVPRVVGSCFTLIEAMRARLERLRPHLQNLPEGTGLSCGIDIGPTSLAMVAGDLTIIGPAVVGAVRMVGAAVTPEETVANVGIGSRLFREQDTIGKRLGFDVRRDTRATKEYPAQEVYVITSRPEWKLILCNWADPAHRH